MDWRSPNENPLPPSPESSSSFSSPATSLTRLLNVASDGEAPFGVDVSPDSGYTVPPYYDSMIGKLIAYGDSRQAAMARMRIALSELVIEGIKTNTALHQELLRDAGFAAGGTNIHYLEKMLADKKKG